MTAKPVGYGNPPIHSRFKKGQSGNPGGRKKGSRNFTTLFREVMEREVPDKGGTRSVPVAQAIVLKQAECALNGDWKAGEKLMDRCERLFADRAEPERELTEEDEQMLDDFVERRVTRRSPGKDPRGVDE
jgi:hypothetical protein